ncbi:cytochrome P450 [Streptomyces paludis]|uniref:Cytochrome P450 n=1 Tax=Streptomyces paludis TaxID=2282738 RepID=A0A345HJ47_9ACTN|nr:cytochrome P450 [Streptomyces paludis]AXG76721.1 cytochrome P450 [Streptomyces paludis]
MAHREKRSWPPGPRGHWLKGNTRAYEADRIGFLRRCHRDYGDVFSYNKHTLFVIDPALTHEALIRTGEAFVTELAPFDTQQDFDLATAHAASWMSDRRAAWPGLNRTAAAATDDLTVAILDTVIADGAGRDVDVLSTMRTLTARMISEYCFGADSAGVPDLLHETVRATRPLAESSHEFPAWLPLPRTRRFFDTSRRLAETLTGKVQMRRAAKPDSHRNDLLGFLLAAEPAPPVNTVASTLHSILMGGHGVPAAALTSLVWELARRPALVADLRSEANGPTDGGTPLAEAVVRETLRLYPPVWLMTRTASRTTTLGDWSLSPGDDVLLNPYLIHRDPRWWPRPDEFDPTRWLNGRPAPGPTYLPFGAGPRVCLGSALTMRQLTLTTSRLASLFTIESPNATSVSLEFIDRLAPTHLKARFLPTG